jgi:hypothetical protein
MLEHARVECAECIAGEQVRGEARLYPAASCTNARASRIADYNGNQNIRDIAMSALSDVRGSTRVPTECEMRSGRDREPRVDVAVQADIHQTQTTRIRTESDPPNARAGAKTVEAGQVDLRSETSMPGSRAASSRVAGRPSRRARNRRAAASSAVSCPLSPVSSLSDSSLYRQLRGEGRLGRIQRSCSTSMSMEHVESIRRAGADRGCGVRGTGRKDGRF